MIFKRCKWPPVCSSTCRLVAKIYFSHRTDPKPRPEGYRERAVETLVHATQWVPSGSETEKVIFRWKARRLGMASQEPVEALEGSQTGKVPPEPSKGQGEPTQGQETASWQNRNSEDEFEYMN